jgi:hypothetical protein
MIRHCDPPAGGEAICRQCFYQKKRKYFLFSHSNWLYLLLMQKDARVHIIGTIDEVTLCVSADYTQLYSIGKPKIGSADDCSNLI